MKRVILNSIGITIFLLLLACGSHQDLTVQEKRPPEELIKDGDMLYQQGNYKEALDTYNRVLLFYPTADLDINAELKIAKCYSKMEKYEKQMDVLLRILKENLIPEYVPEIYIQIGEYYEKAAKFNPEATHGDTTDYKTAVSYYDKAFNYEDSNNKAEKIEALYRKALVEAKLGQTDLAVEQYQRIVDDYPDSPFAVLAQIKLMNPKNTAELSTFSDSLDVYRQRLAKAGKEIPKSQKKNIQEQTNEPSKNQSFEEYLNKNPIDTTKTERPANVRQNQDSTLTPADTTQRNTPAQSDTLKK